MTRRAILGLAAAVTLASTTALAQSSDFNGIRGPEPPASGSSRTPTLKITLDPQQFVRVHRSAAVNIRQLRDLTLTASGGVSARLTSGKEVPVARSCRAELEERLRALT